MGEEEEEEDVEFHITVSRGDSEVAFICSSGTDNRLYVDHIAVETGAPVNFDSLDDAVQDKVRKT